ncbi:polysaccharide lyase 6 family protein [Streptomyces yaizuensis]|uniref:Polysaccharide lyase 6 family protein n=1 Tax=Streptomyces yaizuensis TaxID=2989713 RepID=A0ABQ5NXH5_9ACTN|nr:polysaccharide lyase 6 family protein [Streptomyces sp. YSPA8]GLF95070.1 polysaccharide lyase 6 family protein [Streptomyces sp. YSPA8]
MQRRTFLTGTLLGAAFAAAPVAALTTTAASAATVTVGSLADLQREIDRAAPGDRIVLADGTYTVPAGGSLRISGRHGTGAAHITISSQSRGGAVLQGERSFVLSNSSNITLSGFAFRQRETLLIPADCSGIRLTRNDFGLADITGVHWVVVEGNGVKVDRNYFHDRATQGVFLVADGPGREDMAQDLHIFRNHFARHTYTGDNGGESIRLGVAERALTAAGARVEYNLFERCDGDAEAISVKSSKNVIRYNTLRDSAGGIVLRHGNGSVVEGNHLIGGTEGIRVYGNDHVVVNNHLAGLSGRALVIGSGTARDHVPGEPLPQRRGNDACDRALITHNTLVGNARTLVGEDRAHEPRDVVVSNNLLVADAGSLVALGRNTGFTWQGNLLWGRAADGTIPAGGFVRADPRLQQGADGVFRLSSGSPAIGVAVPTSHPVNDDVDGHPRGSRRDIGADQYATAAPVRAPLTGADVGPNAA